MPNERRLEIKFGREKSVASLFDKEAPRTCEALWRILPFESEVHHSQVVWHEIMFQVPTVIDELENRVYPTPGDLGFWIPRQMINIWYDKAETLGPTNLFGKITENLEGFARESRKAFYKQGAKIRLDKL